MSLVSPSLCSKLILRFLKSLSNQTTNPNLLPQIIPTSPTFQTLRRFSIMDRNGGTANNNHAPASNGGEPGVSQFRLSPTTLLKIQMGDITRWSVDALSDAIVNPANERMLGGGGADGAIHRAAGPELRAACYDVPEVRRGVRCPTGEARITPGFKLPTSHVIHTVGPIYDVDSNPEASLSSAYRNSLRVARENNIQYVAFPAISCGVYGYPYDEAAAIAISSIREFGNDIKEGLQDSEPWPLHATTRATSFLAEVHFVLFADDIYNVWLNKAEELLQN